MKNTLRAKLIAGATVLGLGMSLSLVGVALAANLNWDADTTVTIGANNYTIVSGSGATSMVIGATTLTVTVPAATTFELRSSSKFVLENDQNITSACTSSYSSLRITTAVTAVITPKTSEACSTDGSIYTPPTTPPPASPATAVHPSGTLVISNGTVFLIQNGQRVGFRDAAEYQSHGYNFNQVVNASAGDLALPLSGSVVKALEGTLVIDASDNTTVYMIGSNGTKRGFASADVFVGLGYKFENLPKINVSDYPSGEAINFANLAHPDGALVLNNGTVWWVRGNQRLGFESEAVFNTYGFSWSKIVPANTADMALLVGSLVKFRDGTLVYDGGNYYIISGGNKLMFTSTSDLTARGYQTSNAITASLSGYASGGNVQ